MKPARVLVTGGAGFIGSHIVEHLTAGGAEVTVVDNLATGTIDHLPGGVRFVEGDIRDEPLMTELAAAAHAVFHLAAQVGVRDSYDQSRTDADTNIIGTLSVLRACRNSPVRRFVYASSMAVYADSPDGSPLSEDGPLEPASPYGVSKLAGEKYTVLLCARMGISCSVLRYFNTFGPRQRYTPYVGVMTIFINQLLSGQPLTVFGDGRQVRDFVHVDDVARASILAMSAQQSPLILNIGTGTGTAVEEIARMLKERISPRAGLSYCDQPPGEPRISIADTARAAELIGFTAQRSLQDTLDDIISFNKAARERA